MHLHLIIRQRIYIPFAPVENFVLQPTLRRIHFGPLFILSEKFFSSLPVQIG